MFASLNKTLLCGLVFLLCVLAVPDHVFGATLTWTGAADNVITSVQSGNWSNPGTWDCGCVPTADDIVVIGPHTVTANQNSTISSLNVTSGGTITSNGKVLTITHDLQVDGVITGSLNLVLTGTNTISGTGVISAGNIDLIAGDKTIAAGTSLDNSAASLSTITIYAGVTVRNDGVFITGALVSGVDATSTWIQDDGSGLKLGNEFLLIGTLDASGTGNTIEYFRDGNALIKTAAGSYYNLIISGSDTKALTSDIDINGSLNINSGNFNPAGFSVNIAGDWINNGGFAENGSTVIFDGSGEQTLSVIGGETFYNLQLNNSGAGLVSLENISVTNSLIMTSGNIDMGEHRITLGTGTSNIGTLSHTSGFITGEFERWHNPGPEQYYFPVGGAIYERPVVFINELSSNPGASAGSLIIKFVEMAPGNIASPPLVDGEVNLYNVFTEGYWDIEAANGLTTGPLGTSLYLTGNGFTSHTIGTQTRSVYRPTSAAAWTVTGTSAGNTGNEVRRTSVPADNQSGHWALADNTDCVAPVTPSITGNTIVCKNDSGITYSVTDNGDTYTWTVTGGNITSGQSTNTITVDWGDAGMEGSVAVVAANTCTNTFPVVLPVSIGPLPTSAIIGKTAVPDYTYGEPYSVTGETGYTYNWTVTGGTIASGQGTNSITVDWPGAGYGKVSVTGTNACGNAEPEEIDVIIYYFIETARSGNFENNSTWVCNCTPTATSAIRIMPLHSVRLTASETVALMEIRPAGTLNLNNRNFTVTSDVNIDGIVSGTGTLSLTGNTKEIDGVGSVQNNGNLSISGGRKTISATANISKSNGNVTIANDITVTNNGTLTVNGSLTGGNANSRFINETNATLNVSETLLNSGTLISSASPNTVNYFGSVNQIIFPATYHHLKASGDGIKSLVAGINILGDLEISGSASLDVSASNYPITINGDWINSGIDADPFVERTSTVTFSGSALQTIEAVAGETFYNLVINNTGTEGVTLSGAVTATGQLILTQGILRLGSANRIGDTSPVVLNGGTLSTGSTTGYSDVAGTLSLTENSFIALGTGAHTLSFAASSGQAWTSGRTITITGWTGAFNGTSGTSGRIFVGNSAAGLTPGQLSQILFFNGGYYYSSTILATGEVVPSGLLIQITTNAISGSPFCEGGTVAVPFSITGIFDSGNIFTAQLSDASGSFDAPVSLGTLNSTTAGTIDGTIPLGTPAGTGYRIRVISSTPAITGTANAVDLTVNSLPVATFSYPGSPYCPNAANPFPAFIGGGAAGTFSSTAGLVFVSTATGQVDIVASTPGTYVVTNTIAPSGGCGESTATSQIIISSVMTWTGAGGTDWNASGNWSCGLVPTPAMSAQIPDVPNKPVLSNGANGAVHNLIVDSGSSLTIAGNTISISGAITSNGGLDVTAGTVEMNGPEAQQIEAGIFSTNTINNLVINNTAGVTLHGPLNITGMLSVPGGTLSSDGYLTLASTDAGTALIDGSGAGTVTGNVTMQRYLPSGFGYKYLSSPFQSSTVSELEDDMDLAFFFPLLYSFDENSQYSGWNDYVAGANILNPMEGYAVNFGEVTDPKTIDITGIVNDGSYSVTLYNHNNQFTTGFNLVGNPFPSPIDWNGPGWTKTNIDDAIYFFRASTTDQYGGTYTSYVNGTSSDGFASNIIPSMQGFFVHVSDLTYPVTGTLGVSNSSRINNMTSPFLKSASVNNYRFLVRVTASFTDDQTSTDPLVIYFDNNAEKEFDGAYDALKLLNTDMMVTNFYSVLTSQQKLSINALPEQPDTAIYVPLGLTIYRDGEVSIRIRDVENLPVGESVFLHDAVTGANVDMLRNNDYKVTLTQGEYDGRFFLAFFKSTTGINRTEEPGDVFSAYLSGSIVKATVGFVDGNEGVIAVYDVAGKQGYSMKVYEPGQYELKIEPGQGIYIVSYKTGTLLHSIKMVLGVGR